MLRSLLVAMLLTGCAAGNTEKPPAPAAPVQQECPKVDLQRVNEISDIDRENQEQLSKVSELEQKLAALQEKLAGAMKNTNEAAPNKEAVSVASTGGKVRVRLSDELVFHPGSARITVAGRKALDQLTSALKDSPSKRIEVVGHTDSAPMQKKYRDNWELSLERARRVGTYLISQGLDQKRLVMSGYADTDPVDTADTDEARAKNRRVEIFVEPTAQ